MAITFCTTGAQAKAKAVVVTVVEAVEVTTMVAESLH